MPGSREEDVINHLVGSRLKSVRKEKHLSLKDVASCFDISTQQLQKYEDGTNRVSAAKLFLLCLKYNIDINYFSVGANAKYSNCNGGVSSDEKADMAHEADLDRLVKGFRNIKDVDIRKSIINLVNKVAE